MPWMISEKNGLEMSGTVTRILFDRRVRRFLATELGAYPICSTVSSTRRLVSGETTFGRLMTRDTVDAETPARLATS